MKTVFMSGLIIFATYFLPSYALALSPTMETADCMNTPVEKQSEECKRNLKDFDVTIRKWNAENDPTRYYSSRAIAGYAISGVVLIGILAYIYRQTTKGTM